MEKKSENKSTKKDYKKKGQGDLFTRTKKKQSVSNKVSKHLDHDIKESRKGIDEDKDLKEFIKKFQ
jgi:hypothetical protein